MRIGLKGVINLWDSRDRREQEIKIKRCDRVARVSGLYFKPTAETIQL